MKKIQLRTSLGGTHQGLLRITWNFRVSGVHLLDPGVAGMEHQSQSCVMLESTCAKQGPVELIPSPMLPVLGSIV